jgi:hypothetical protein
MSGDRPLPVVDSFSLSPTATNQVPRPPLRHSFRSDQIQNERSPAPVRVTWLHHSPSSPESMTDVLSSTDGSLSCAWAFAWSIESTRSSG